MQTEWSLAQLEWIDGERPIGRGTFSKVFRCRHKGTGQLCAVKVIEEMRLCAADRAALETELRVHARLAHPRVIGYLGSFRAEGRVYIAVEFAAGKSLFNYIHPRKGLSEGLALRFLFQAATAVSYLHAHNVIHRDIKPENALLTQSFTLKLCDFGWACEADAEPALRSTLCGTFEYMSPEVCQKIEHGSKTDIWCLGVLFYEMVVGQPPYRPSSNLNLLQLLRANRLKLPDWLSPAAQELLGQMLAHDPTQRPSAAQVLRHPVFGERGQAVTGPLSDTQRAELTANYDFINGVDNLRLIEEAERLVNKKASTKQDKTAEKALAHAPVTAKRLRLETGGPTRGWAQIREQLGFSTASSSKQFSVETLPSAGKIETPRPSPRQAEAKEEVSREVSFATPRSHIKLLPKTTSTAHSETSEVTGSFVVAPCPPLSPSGAQPAPESSLPAETKPAKCHSVRKYFVSIPSLLPPSRLLQRSTAEYGPPPAEERPERKVRKISLHP